LEYGTHLEKNIVYNYKHIMPKENPHVWSGSRQEDGSYTNVAGPQKKANAWAAKNVNDPHRMFWEGGKKSKRRNHKRSKRRRFSCRRR